MCTLLFHSFAIKVHCMVAYRSLQTQTEIANTRVTPTIQTLTFIFCQIANDQLLATLSTMGTSSLQSQATQPGVYHTTRMHKNLNKIKQPKQIWANDPNRNDGIYYIYKISSLNFNSIRTLSRDSRQTWESIAFPILCFPHLVCNFQIH